jgi:hypothetical protein
VGIRTETAEEVLLVVADGLERKRKWHEGAEFALEVDAAA